MTSNKIAREGLTSNGTSAKFFKESINIVMVEPDFDTNKYI
jgi:hypothetical protein